MINFDEELKKFHPSVEIGNSSGTVEGQSFEDVTDEVIRLMQETGRAGRKMPHADPSPLQQR